MKHRHGVRDILLSTLILAAAAGPLAAQPSSGSVIMRSQNTVTWWVVDEESGRAAFFGGDIVAICQQDPEGYDLLDFQEVEQPNDVATNLVARGDGIGTSLWAKAPTFAGAALCRDVLAAGEPLATGSSDLNIMARFPTTWAEADITMPYGMTARGTVWTPEGEEMSVNARFRCVSRSGETKCTQGLTVR